MLLDCIVSHALIHLRNLVLELDLALEALYICTLAEAAPNGGLCSRVAQLEAALSLENCLVGRTVVARLARLLRRVLLLEGLPRTLGVQP